MADLTPPVLPSHPATRKFPKRLATAAAIAGALLLSACGSSGEDAAPSSIPFDDSASSNSASSNTEEVTPARDQAITPRTVAPEATSPTSVVVSTGSESDPEPEAEPEQATEPEIVYSQADVAAVLRVDNVSSDDVLNIRSAPGAFNDIVGTLTHDAWYVQATANEATVDGVLWIEVEKGDGTIGYVHSNYVTETNGNCEEIYEVTDPISTVQTTGDLDGDGLQDDVNLIVSDPDVVLEISYGSGAEYQRRFDSTPMDVLDGLGFYAVSTVDIDGDGRDELRVDDRVNRWTGTTFYRAVNACEVWAYGNGGSVFNLGTYGSAGSPILWSCRDAGTPDLTIYTSVGRQTDDGMVFDVTNYGFDIKEGFVPLADNPPFTISAEEFNATASSAPVCEL